MSQPGPFGRLAAFVLGSRARVAVGMVVAAILGAAGASQLGVDANLLSMLPQDLPEVVGLQKLHREEGGANLITLAFEGDDEQEIDAFVDELTSELGALDTVQFAIDEIDPALALEIGVLQLDPADVDELSRRLQGALAMGPALNPMVTQRLMAMGPLTERIASAQAPTLLAGSGLQRKILVRPTGSAHDLPFAAKVMGDVTAAVDAARPADAGVRLRWIGGAYRHATEDRDGIVSDLRVTTGVSALAVCGLLVAAFRSWRSVVALFLPLLVGVAIQLGCVYVLFRDLNTYTSVGAAIVFGLGIDFGIHLAGRYREEREAGHAIEPAIIRAWDRVGPPSSTAALTSIAGFLALTVADFRGFSQLGVTLAIGLAACLGTMLVGLPVLLPALDGGVASSRSLFGIRVRENPSVSTYRLAPLGLMVVALVTVLVATRLPPSFEYDVSALRSQGLAWAELDEAERALVKDSYSPVLVSYPDRAALVADQQRVEAELAANPRAHVGTVVSIENILPSDMEARVAALAVLKAQVQNPNMRYLPPPLVENLLPITRWDGDGLTRAQLPEGVLSLLGVEREDVHRLLVFPKGNMWDLREAAAFRDEIAALVPGRDVVGEYTALGAMYGVIQRDVPLVAAVALALVLLLSALDLRKPAMIAAGGSTLLAGIIWAGVVIDGLGLSFSIINVVAVPILLGIGVDVVIFLLHRLEEEGPGGVRRALATTGVAAMLSTLTTMASFAALILASNRGVRSLGLMVVVGLATTFLVAAGLLPLIRAAGWRVTGRAPGHRRRPRG
jgi:predicted RND superfamily exporter protein